jgi:hypothetical protein
MKTIEIILAIIAASLALNMLLFIWWRCARKDADIAERDADEWRESSRSWEDHCTEKEKTNDALRAEIIAVAIKPTNPHPEE